MIHIAIQQLGIEEDDYRAILWTVCRAKSAADLDSFGRAKLLQHFRSLGWRPKSRRRQPPQERKIWSLWYQLRDAGLIADASARGLRTEVRKLTGVDDLRFCTTDQLSLVIECFKQWLARAEEDRRGQ